MNTYYKVKLQVSWHVVSMDGDSYGVNKHRDNCMKTTITNCQSTTAKSGNRIRTCRNNSLAFYVFRDGESLYVHIGL